jgi:hypothetical protein
MSQPPQEVNTLFEDLRQDLSRETVPMPGACTCTACTRAPTVETPGQWLRLVWLYEGVERSLRGIAGHRHSSHTCSTYRSGMVRLDIPWRPAISVTWVSV